MWSAPAELAPSGIPWHGLSLSRHEVRKVYAPRTISLPLHGENSASCPS
jgi:hypothetical protein